MKEIRFFLILIAVGLWVSLKDLPPTDKGGFWFYFKWVYIVIAIEWIILEIINKMLYKK